MWTGCWRPWPNSSARLAGWVAVEGIAVVPGGAGLEADPLVEPARRLPRWPRGQVHGPGARGLGQVQRLSREDLADSLSPGRLIDDHVLDPGAEPGGDREHHQGQRAGDLVAGSPRRPRRLLRAAPQRAQSRGAHYRSHHAEWRLTAARR